MFFKRSDQEEDVAYVFQIFVIVSVTVSNLALSVSTLIHQGTRRDTFCWLLLAGSIANVLLGGVGAPIDAAFDFYKQWPLGQIGCVFYMYLFKVLLAFRFLILISMFAHIILQIQTLSKGKDGVTNTLDDEDEGKKGKMKLDVKVTVILLCGTVLISLLTAVDVLIAKPVAETLNYGEAIHKICYVVNQQEYAISYLILHGLLLFLLLSASIIALVTICIHYSTITTIKGRILATFIQTFLHIIVNLLFHITQLLLHTKPSVVENFIILIYILTWMDIGNCALTPIFWLLDKNVRDAVTSCCKRTSKGDDEKTKLLSRRS